MLETLNQFWQEFPARGLPATLLLVILLITVRWLLRRIIRRRLKLSDELKTKWLAAVKNMVFIVGILGLVLIWAPQLRTFALSLTAVAVAIVIATKELILCISGSLVRASSGTFTLGDLIEFSGHTGFIVDQNLLVTELREYDPESQQLTGRQIVLPNSLFLSNAVRHLNLLRPYGIRTLAIYLASTEQPIAAVEAAVKNRIERAWEKTQAEMDFQLVLRARGRHLGGFSPLVRVTTTHLAHVAIVATYICHDTECLELEADIHRLVFDLVQQQTAQRPATQAV